MDARKKQVIKDFLHDDIKDLEKYTEKVLDTLYTPGLRWHNENLKYEVDEIKRLLSYWRTTSKNL